MRVFLCSPPTGFFIRDERCQIDANSRVAENIREPIQILYLGGLLKKYNYEILIKDYRRPSFGIKDVLSDMSKFKPDCFYMETTQGTFGKDIKFIHSLGRLAKDVLFIIKAPFLDARYLDEQILSNGCDINNKIYFVIRNFEITILDILKSRGKTDSLNNALVLVNKEIVIPKGEDISSEFDMDEYPSPPRNLLNKNDYTRPDTNEPIAYIYTSKGCPQNCIFCSAPVYLGRKVQTRSVEKVIDEVKECIEKYKINNFFFRSDSFTFDKKWVTRFCDKVIDENIKINWGANSRVDILDKNMFEVMKSAGCYIIGFGVESCSNEILKKIKKGIRVNDIKCVHQLVKKTGIKTFLHCIVGFPWDSHKTIDETKKLLLELEPDFIEVNVPYPLKGTELYNFAEKNNLFVSKNFENYSHIKPILRTFSLEANEVSRLRKDLIASFYLRPKYIIKKFKSIRHPKIFLNYVKWGCRLMKKIFL